MTIRIGVDTGGTFTDVVLYDDETGEIHTTKTPSTPSEFDQGVLNGIDKILEETGSEATRTSYLSHGTTVGTNAVLESEIPDLGLITNSGLRDVLEIGDQTRPELYNLQADKPPQLVPRKHRFGVPGRLDSNGNVVDKLNEGAVREAVVKLEDAGVDSIVVSMLFSYLNDEHEQRIGEIIEAETDLDYALSSAVYPETREYDRTVTTVLNEAVKVTIQDYLGRLDAGIEERGIDVPLNVMHSGGGIFGTEQATDFALRTVLSGPAAGAVACRDVSTSEGFSNAIGLDMGGTSSDVSIVEDGSIVRSTEGEINNLPINTPLVDINTVGAGGGSIAWIDNGGGLRVGPKSAGADPGPICYGRGGTEPTVTDANLILGRIDPDVFLDGDMQPAMDRARTLFQEKIAEPLGLSPEEAAMNVLQVANAKMAREIRRVTIERGRDPADYTLVPFGGAGPLQAPSVAQNMDMDSLLLPRTPGVLSARGLLLADVRMDESQAYTGSEIDHETVREEFDSLESELLSRFAGQGFEENEVDLGHQLDLRYSGQAYELTVPLPGESYSPENLEQGIEQFHELHRELYGYAMPDEPIDLVTLRLAGTVSTKRITDDVTITDGETVKSSREVYFDGPGFVKTPIVDRATLPIGDTVEGPAIIEESGCTSILPPETSATVSERGNLLIEL
ncbi:hydantoinase/oxoprolinase family protein [Haloferax sp. AB510]|uniref:hydantoinase/oxoprolinase family protein n=1 Tax=unclassified Haloferax TaxID=2625095 RepID=UPI0005B1FA01|nr:MULTISPECIES: hydantoinase/oxoprolinase family protein [unclassified Haloferax]MCO8265407.1 hydantoinase/oxoprolinase family protein [Haloferax sp. AB510]